MKILYRPSVMILLSMPFLYGGVAYADALAPNQARFGQVTGAVQVLAQGVSQWVDAHEGLPIESGDQIHVDEESQAELVISQHAVWFLMDQTDVVVGHTTTDEAHLTLSSGTLTGFAEPVNGLAQAWTFETPMAVAVVRGTEFLLSHADHDGTRLGVVKGVIELQPAETATQTFPAVAVNAKEEYLVVKGGKMKKGVLGAAMQPALAKLPNARKRFQILSDTWTPFTEQVRQENRKKFVPAAQKMRPVRRSVDHRKAGP